MHFCSIESGSKGNSYIVKTDSTVVLVDAGISRKKIIAGLDAMDTTPQEVAGVLLTHEHTDHSKSARTILDKCPNASLYTSGGTWERLCDRPEEDRLEVVADGDRFQIGDISISSFAIHHDASEPLGFSFESGGRKLAIVTDTGFICDNIMEEIQDANVLVLESNHDEDMLAVGRYPYNTKRRIAGNLGHLSNASAAECLCKIYRSGMDADDKRTVFLAHMSEENNTPELASITIKSRLSREAVVAGGMFDIKLACQKEMSEIIEV